jgi:hypothetical protein
MRMIFGSRRHQYSAMAGIFLVTVVLIAGIIGCDETGESYNLTITSTSGGSVVEPGQGVFTYYEGTVVDLIATANASCCFATWTGDVSTIANTKAAATNITMNGEYEITANFGTYNVQTIYTASKGMYQIHSGDIDGDGLFEASILRNASGSWFVDYDDGDYVVSEVPHLSACVYGDVADTDGDGRAEIIVASSDAVQIVSCNATGVFQIDATIPIAGGANGVIAGKVGSNESMRIIAGSYSSGYVHVFKYQEGNYVEEWSDIVVPDSAIFPTVAGDVDNDGHAEFLMNVWENPGHAPSNGNIYVYKWTGSTYEPIFDQHTDAEEYMPAAITDLDRDGNNELIIYTDEVTVYKYSSYSGKFEYVWSVPDGNLLQIAIGDPDADGQDEALCFFPWDDLNKIAVIGYDGADYNVEAEVTGFPGGLGGGTVADFDGDGQDEIITSLFNVVAAEYPIYLISYLPP